MEQPAKVFERNKTFRRCVFRFWNSRSVEARQAVRLKFPLDFSFFTKILIACRGDLGKFRYSVTWISSWRLTLLNIKSPPKMTAKRAKIIPIIREFELSYFWNEYKKYAASPAAIKPRSAYSKSFTKTTSNFYKKVVNFGVSKDFTKPGFLGLNQGIKLSVN